MSSPTKPFSFFNKPNMQLGLPGEQYATRVDFDGQIDTLSGKFHFYIGDSIEPVNQRIWTLTDGYLPEINYKILDTCVKCNECIEILGCPAINAEYAEKEEKNAKNIEITENLSYYIDDVKCVPEICPGICKTVCKNFSIKKTVFNPKLKD